MNAFRIITTLIFACLMIQRAAAYTSFFQVAATNIQDSPIRVKVTDERGQKRFQVFVILDSWGKGWSTNAAFKGRLDGQWLPPRFVPNEQQPAKGASKPDEQARFDFVVPTAQLDQRRFMVCVYGRSHGEPEEMRRPYMVWWFCLSDFAGNG